MKLTIKKENTDVKFVGKISDNSYLVELLDKPGYGCILNLLDKKMSHVLRVEAFPKWVTILELPSDFVPPCIDMSEFSNANSARNI